MISYVGAERRASMPVLGRGTESGLEMRVCSQDSEGREEEAVVEVGLGSEEEEEEGRGYQNAVITVPMRLMAAILVSRSLMLSAVWITLDQRVG